MGAASQKTHDTIVWKQSYGVSTRYLTEPTVGITIHACVTTSGLSLSVY